MSRIIGATVPSSDHHAGWDYIPSTQTVIVAQYKQMVVFGDFLNDGEIQIEGTLVIEE